MHFFGIFSLEMIEMIEMNRVDLIIKMVLEFLSNL